MAGTKVKGLERKQAEHPDESRAFPKGKLDVFHLGGTQVGIAAFQPGWKWSECVQPIAKTHSCETRHLGYVVRGRIKIVMDDGSEAEFGPGDLMACEPGHDAWVIGSEPCEIVDFLAAPTYARR